MTRFWYLICSTLISLVGCTSDSTVATATPESTTVQLTTNNIDIRLRTLPGWLAYTEEDNIILSGPVNERGQSPVINVWSPHDVNVDEQTSVDDILRTIADRLEERASVAAGPPIATQWRGYDAGYFLINSERQGLTMILIVDVREQGLVAFNITDITPEFLYARDTLNALFAEFSVNDVALGGDIFVDIPDVLMVPPLRPEAALEGSTEP